MRRIVIVLIILMMMSVIGLGLYARETQMEYGSKEENNRFLGSWFGDHQINTLIFCSDGTYSSDFTFASGTWRIIGGQLHLDYFSYTRGNPETSIFQYSFKNTNYLSIDDIDSGITYRFVRQ